MMMGELLDKGEIAQARRLSVLFGKKTHDLELILVSGISFCIFSFFKNVVICHIFISIISLRKSSHRFIA